MKRILALVICCGLLLALGTNPVGAGKKKEDPVKEALQELNDFIGEWKGAGTVPNDKFLIWTENADFGWRFKGKDSWLELKVPNGKHLKGGVLRYLPDEEIYEFAAVDKDNKTVVFKGMFKGTRLVLDRIDPVTKEGQRIEMYSAGGGVRFIYDYKVKSPNFTLHDLKYQVAFTRKGEEVASSVKKNECVVTGGLGTIQVSYMGMTYYVCCSGCRDAFTDNPAKIIAEYEKKKKKK